MGSTFTVAFPLYPDCTLLDFAGATQVFAFTPGFSVLWVAETLEPILTTENVKVLPHKTFAQVQSEGIKIDLLFVPGAGSGVAKQMLNPAYIGFLQTVGPAAQWAGSVCTGGFLMATAGLLDGCRASTYWSQLPQLRLFPTLTVEPGYPRWVIDEEKHRFTGGGISSSIDLALELVQRLVGVETRLATQLSIQYAPDPPLPPSGDPSKAPVQTVVEVTEGQADFVAAVKQATQEVVGD
jgi:cyclohexyl-isocyanide hydratase